MKRGLALASLILLALLSAILVWVFTHSGELGAAPAHPIDVQTPAGPSPTASPALQPTKNSALIAGYTRQKTPIHVFVFGHGEKHVLIIGGIHGDEGSSTLAADALSASFDRDPVPADLTVVVVPRFNPDGLKAGSRTNSAGVDLNRNFPAKTWRTAAKGRYYPGPAPSSEPETRALIALVNKWSPVLIVSIHAPLNCINWDGPAEKAARAMVQASGYSLCEDIGYETPGSLGSYAGKDRNTPIITFELRDVGASEEITSEAVSALKAALKFISATARAAG